MGTVLGRVLIYTDKIDEMTGFYARYFGYAIYRSKTDPIVELRSRAEGMTLLLHPLRPGQDEGQSQVKLVFDVEDVAGFCASAKADGLDFGEIIRMEGCAFANVRDPAGHTIQVSDRVFAQSQRGQGDYRPG
ncbi:VOC family protein [Celeribacter neptunius]|uniref:Glyoxalase-like domain-containing protein n=1 Tax=Celeribacter neptunius TaxID=588602 RepID=A0A1I3VC72_9RHOB|nr:VOC family protein [Celeribacter neptunius]SFJ92802.1 Glyoxalase-like domain-containing protein [Celeribacter neptunius]